MSLEQLKELIMQEFEKNNCKENEIVPMRNYRFGILSQLNPKEQDSFVDAVNALIAEGKIIYEPDGLECLRLTKEGFDSLYASSLTSEQLADMVMDLFKQTRCRVGQVIPMRSIRLGLMMNLNPIESKRIIDAINGLIGGSYIEYSKSPSEALILKQKGFDYIYQ